MTSALANFTTDFTIQKTSGDGLETITHNEVIPEIIPEKKKTKKENLLKNTVSLKSLNNSILTKEEKIKKVNKKSALANEKIQQVSNNKEKLQKGYLQDLQCRQKKEDKKYKERIFLIKKRRVWLKVTKAFLAYIL